MINHIADELIANLDQESALLPSLKQQLRECEKSIQNMLNAIEAGIITPSTKQRLQDLEARREELNVSILQEQLQKPRFTKGQIVTWISRFKYGDPDDLEYQKQMIDTFVNSVYVYDDRLVMTYNYKDGTETISLDAVHQAFGSDLASDAPLKDLQRCRSFFAFIVIFCRLRVRRVQVSRRCRGAAASKREGAACVTDCFRAARFIRFCKILTCIRRPKGVY